MAQISMVRGGAVALLALAVAGCQTSSQPSTQTTPAPTSGTGSEFREDPVRSDPGGGSSATLLRSIYFDYDRYDIRADAKTVLRSNADGIKKNSKWGTITVEGHCDERGSEEYNLALGERRANAVKRYLVDLGVAPSRLRTVSFGEAKPAVMGHDESAWRYNRRTEFRSRGN
jgi:peptidoglycan-associated lipoprotein